MREREKAAFKMESALLKCNIVVYEIYETREEDEI
jgi:hypothetical protein